MNLINALTSDTSLLSGTLATEVTDPLVLQELKNLNMNLSQLQISIDTLVQVLGKMYDGVIPPGVRKIGS